MRAAVAMMILLTAAVSAQEAEIRFEDSPLDGRVVVLDNGLVQAAVAPQIGGRLMRLQRSQGQPVITFEADWRQAKESVWSSEGSVGISVGEANAWTATAGDQTAAIRWEHSAQIKGLPVRVTRELAVARDVPVVFLRVTVHNEGDRVLPGVGYTIAPHFYNYARNALHGETPLDAAGLVDTATRVNLPAVRLTVGDTEVIPRFGPGEFGIIGESYMFRITHSLRMGDIAPGQSGTAQGLWWLLPAGTEPPGEPQLDWSFLSGWNAVSPLTVRDTPPNDLPKTPVLEGATPWGICGHTGPDYMPLWQAAGVKCARKGFGWAAGEREPGTYDFTAMDATVDAAEQAGVQLIGLVHSNPPWATVDGATTSPPRDLAAWERYVETVARRYAGRVNIWEIWNEPDISQFWTGTVEDYTALLASAYRGAKRGNPDCFVMSAGLDGHGERYLMEMARIGAFEFCDLVGFHPYAGNPDLAEGRVRAAWRVLNHFGVRKPIWVTEVGWQSGGWKGGPGVVDSEATKAAYLAEIYPRLEPLAEVTCWYVDSEAGDMYGLIRPKDGGIVLNEAFHRFREGSGAAQDNRLTISGPESVSVKAAQPNTAQFRVRNQSDEPLPLDGFFYAPVPWASVHVEGATLQPGDETTLELRIEPPVYAVARKMPCVMVARSPRGPACLMPFTLDLTNDGESVDISMAAQWPIQADAEGKQVGKWTPAHSLVTPPGGFRIHPFKITNSGNAPHTFRVHLEGPAAEWAKPPAETVTIKPGETAWIGVHLAIPRDAEPGTRTLRLRIISTKYPEVTACDETPVRVGAQEEQP